MIEAQAFTKCDSAYHLDKCSSLPDKANFEYFINQSSVRQSLHVGKTPFEMINLDVYMAVREDIMQSELENLGLLLEKYQVHITLLGHILSSCTVNSYPFNA